MYMFRDVMMFLTGGINRVNMDCSIGQITQMMQKLMSRFISNVVSFFNRDLRINGYVHLCMKPMA